MRRRVPGDKISLSAYIRSDIVSDGNEGGREDVDIEESVSPKHKREGHGLALYIYMLCIRANFLILKIGEYMYG